ncbi:MAG TPA: UPF0182 family protein [Actinomycetota bacterium]|nr:UPF0182 family protein [Actinomycetota bacterium]
MAPPARRSRRRAILVVAVVAFLLAASSIARFYTDVLWFQEVGFESVLWTSIRTQALVGLVVAVAVAAIVWVNLLVAARAAPVYGGFVGGGGRTIVDPMERYRDALTPYLRWLRIGVAAGLGVLAGIGASAAWRTVLLWLNRVPFGERDPQFDRDVAFYVFDLPFFRTVLDVVWFALIASVLVTLVAHAFHGSLRPQMGLRGVTPGALAHVSVLLGLMALVKALQYYFGTFGLNFSERGIVTGASYTDVNAHLHALRLLAIISVVSAVLFIVNIRFRRLSLPLAAVAIWVLTSFLAGFVWPLAIQSFVVGPQELQREREFIARNIAGTREAFGLTDISVETYPALQELTAADIAGSENVLNNVRLWDPGTMGEAYEQLQAIDLYYRFPDVDIDRYEIAGETRQVLVSARELSIDDLPPQSQGWQNQHLQYTHGYGLVASLANTIGPGGEPDFIVGGVPGRAEPGAEALEADQPRIYFGEGFEDNEYSIVNSGQAEVDYPTDEGLVRFEYDGEGGIELSNFFRRIAFAMREADPNLVLSGLVNPDSRVLIYRNIRDRVRRAAPFLALDSDPYVANVDGRLVWILDAYTTTPWYPYSERYEAGASVADEGASGALSGTVNYVRNSVKVVVDAYEGDITLYVVDEEDPLIQAWRGAFPALFTDEEPSDDLRAHFRYPEDLFNLQTEVYRTYHMTEPDVFFTGARAWELPENPATYLLTQLPGETEEEFLLSRTATPRRKRNMVAIMVARSDPESYGELRSFVMPSESQVNGPAQAFSLINQDVEVSEARTLLGVRGSVVSFGSLVILPIEGSILYVQPMFVTAEDVGIPELKKVALVLGDEVVFEDTFDEALAALFDLEEPAEPDERPDPADPDEPGTDGEPDEPGGPAAPELARLVEQAGRVYEAAQEALAAGDFEEYGRLIERLGQLLDRAGLATEQAGNQRP